MIKGMKNKEQTREDKIKARMEYQKQASKLGLDLLYGILCYNIPYKH